MDNQKGTHGSLNARLFAIHIIIYIMYLPNRHNILAHYSHVLQSYRAICHSYTISSRTLDPKTKPVIQGAAWLHGMLPELVLYITT